MGATLSPQKFATAVRRAEWLRFAPFFVLSAAIVGGLLAMWVVQGFIAFLVSLVWLGSLIAMPAAYLAAYVSALLHGRTFNPPGGSIDVAEGAMTVHLGERSTTFALERVQEAQFFVDACPFEALKGLEDVLALSVDGAVLRVPETVAGVHELAKRLPCPVSYIDVE